ncbi:MAG: hypothetical protein IKP97_06095 [Kiritimatiellae bacterium]|nr:hypothetical protein [Kiritimatiellia bacterium]
MKKLMLLTSTLVAGLAFASSVSSTQTFGVLKVASDLEQTVISVPWVAAGTGEDIMVKDFVKTNGLNNGTMLYKYVNASGEYKAWTLTNNGWDGIESVSSFGGKTARPGSTDTLSQQDAIIIVRQAGNTSGDIYLYGQYSDASDLTYTIDRSKGATLVSPVNTTGSTINLNSDVTWTNAKQGDLIKLHTAGGSAPTYRYDGTRTEDNKYWGRKVNGQWEEAVVQPGMGFWYTPSDNSGTTTFTLQ